MRLPLVLLLLALAAAPAAEAQSLYQRGRANHVALIADNKARRVGDVVTIAIEERQLVEADEQVTLEKESSASAELTSFPLKPELGSDVLPVGWNAERSFEGNADVKKQGTFVTQVTATVIDVQPNGNLVVEGRRKVVLDGEEKWMTIAGVVRPFDVSAANVVRSALVANARITYESCGPLARTTKKGWFERLVDFLWPF